MPAFCRAVASTQPDASHSLSAYGMKVSWSFLKELLFFRDFSENPACLQISRTVGFSTQYITTVELKVLTFRLEIILWRSFHICLVTSGHTASRPFSLDKLQLTLKLMDISPIQGILFNKCRYRAVRPMLCWFSKIGVGSGWSRRLLLLHTTPVTDRFCGSGSQLERLCIARSAHRACVLWTRVKRADTCNFNKRCTHSRKVTRWMACRYQLFIYIYIYICLILLEPYLCFRTIRFFDFIRTIFMFQNYTFENFGVVRTLEWENHKFTIGNLKAAASPSLTPTPKQPPSSSINCTVKTRLFSAQFN